MGVVTLNIWTGAPLLGLWVGSKVAPAPASRCSRSSSSPWSSASAALLLLQLLGVLQAAHARASGRELPRRQTSWLKPMSGARTRGKGAVAPPLTATDYVVIGAVVLAVAAFEAWFFLFAGSSLG